MSFYQINTLPPQEPQLDITPSLKWQTTLPLHLFLSDRLAVGQESLYTVPVGRK